MMLDHAANEEKGPNGPLCSLSIIAWNPNGIRALMDKSSGEVKRLLAEHDPDIIIWNEIKGNRSKEQEIKTTVNKVMPGYQWIFNCAEKAGRHGLAIAYKPNIEILSSSLGFAGHEREKEGRIITLELHKCFVVGIYAVNAGMQEVGRLDYKVEWLVTLLAHIKKLKEVNPNKAVIIMGDWNVAPNDIDIHNPKRNQHSAGFTIEERTTFKFIQDHGWIDVYRTKNPDRVQYTFWDAKSKQRERGSGWRIDLAVIDKESYEKLQHCESEILDTFMGSDHCPISLNLTF
ncbi:MAG: exodeoxyribonuclease III [Nitrososphaerota archaeon]|nr:exodeoxyribonuclease III [Nitrososphaerota archaeon]